MSKTVREVGQLLGCSDELVKAAYLNRDLPGYALPTEGGGYRYLMTDEAFELLKAGAWDPKPRRVLQVARACQSCMAFLPMTMGADGDWAWHCPECGDTGIQKEDAA